MVLMELRSEYQASVGPVILDLKLKIKKMWKPAKMIASARLSALLSQETGLPSLLACLKHAGKTICGSR